MVTWTWFKHVTFWWGIGSGIEPLSDRVRVTRDFPVQKTLNERSFLDMVNVYQRFVPKAVHIFAPWIYAVRKIAKTSYCPSKSSIFSFMVFWSSENFWCTKKSLQKATLLHHPVPNALLSLWTVASNTVSTQVSYTITKSMEVNWIFVNQAHTESAKLVGLFYKKIGSNKCKI